MVPLTSSRRVRDFSVLKPPLDFVVDDRLQCVGDAVLAAEYGAGIDGVAKNCLLGQEEK